MDKNNNLKIKITNFIKKRVILRKLAREIYNIIGFIIFKIRTLGKKVDDNIIFFYAFKGKSYSCSPKAVYEYMISKEEYKNYKYIWAFSEPEKYEFLNKNHNTKIIKYGGTEYQKALAKAKYWIVNYKIEDYIYPKKNQIYVQCWHGTPLKKLGYDLHGTYNVMNSEQEIHDKYRIDASKFKYLLSPSPFTTKVFSSAWNLQNTNNIDKIIEVGYPRNDFLYNYTDKDIKVIKEKLQLPNNKKIILYAPTWRDDEHQAGIGYTYKTQVDFEFLRQHLQDNYVILFRAHYLIANSFDFKKYDGFVYDVSNIDDINEIYIISDILITDYSSVFFDYSNLKRPMIFYMYDYEKYKDKLRGFYIDLNELPGDIVKTEQELIEAIDKAKEFNYNEKYKKFHEKYNCLDDGKASQRFIEAIQINNNAKK